MTLWKYIHLESDNKTVPIDKVYKEPYVWSVIAPDSDYLEATAQEIQDTAILQEVVVIEKRKKDGILAYEKALAKMRLGRLQNSIPHETYRLNVYVPMDEVIDSVNKGSWIDAYEFLNLVTPNTYLTASTLTDFRLTISNYIVNSGNYSEYSGSSIDANGYII